MSNLQWLNFIPQHDGRGQVALIADLFLVERLKEKERALQLPEP